LLGFSQIFFSRRIDKQEEQKRPTKKKDPSLYNRNVQLQHKRHMMLQEAWQSLQLLVREGKEQRPLRCIYHVMLPCISSWIGYSFARLSCHWGFKETDSRHEGRQQTRKDVFLGISCPSLASVGTLDAVITSKIALIL
jgi:hypothetical protein